MEPSYASGISSTPLLGDTIGDNLDRTIARFGDREALVSVHQDLRYTYDPVGNVTRILDAAQEPDGDMGPGPRGKIKASLDYLAVAPTVVAVARDIDLGSPGLTLPKSPADPEMLTAIAEQWGLTSPVQRLTDVICF